MLEHLYLSPHLDDAVFSCGGLIARQTEQGQSAGVLTVCAGDPPSGPLTPFAQALHATWGEEGNPAAARRAEDLKACGLLGAETKHMAIPDAVYRRSAREPAYPDFESIFGPLHPGEGDLVKAVAQGIAAWRGDGTLVYCPLGIGGHVDHRLVRLAAESVGSPIWYYQDMPYVSQGGMMPSDLSLPDGREHLVDLSAAEIESWARAAAAYQSQISSFWDDEQHLRRDLFGYCQTQGGLKLIEVA